MNSYEAFSWPTPNSSKAPIRCVIGYVCVRVNFFNTLPEVLGVDRRTLVYL